MYFCEKISDNFVKKFSICAILIVGGKIMKKGFMFLAVCMVLFLASGCEDSKEISCTLSRNDKINGYSLDATYKINATGEVVNSVNSTEEVTTDKASLITAFEEQYNSTYGTMNEEYGGYDYKITKGDNKITADVTIDYSKLDLDALAKDEPTMKNIMNDNNEITVTGLQAQYEAMGATCK